MAGILLFGLIFRKVVVLLALEDIHDLDGVGQFHFLERHADLAAIWGTVGIQIDRHAGLLGYGRAAGVVLRPRGPDR